MVRYANRSKISVSVLKGSTPCATHHFPGGSLHAPYDPLPLLAVGKLMIKAHSIALTAKRLNSKSRAVQRMAKQSMVNPQTRITSFAPA